MEHLYDFKFDDRIFTDNDDQKEYYSISSDRYKVRLDLHPEIREIIFDSTSPDEISSRLMAFSLKEIRRLEGKFIEYYVTGAGMGGLFDRYYASPDLAVATYLNEREHSEVDYEIAFYQKIFEQPGLKLERLYYDNWVTKKKSVYHRCIPSESEK